MRAEIISIGDELLTGQKMDTNSVYLGDKLEEAGVEVLWKTTVGDRQERIKEAFRMAQDRADVIIATGGLGPTDDDVTVKGVAEFLSRKLVFHPQILEEIEEKFRSRGRTMPECNRSQAFLPQGATLLDNARGMAPGIFIQERGTLFFLLPGVPTEMRPMFEKFVLPKVRAMTKGGVILRRVLRTTGISESQISDGLDSLVDEAVKIAFLPQFTGVDLQLTVYSDDRKKGEVIISAMEANVRRKFAEFIYGFGQETMEAIVARLLTERAQTLAVAESCTGGLIGHRLTNVPGSSHYFERGIVAYSNRAKMEILGVSGKTIQRYGAVSFQTAEAMARGVRDLSGVDYGLSVTGIAGPTGGTAEKPVGLVYVGLAHVDGSLSEEFRFGQDRRENKVRSAQAALNLLRKFLLKG